MVVLQKSAAYGEEGPNLMNKLLVAHAPSLTALQLSWPVDACEGLPGLGIAIVDASLTPQITEGIPCQNTKPGD